MPNHREPTLESADLEKARPWGADRFAEAEPQDRRGETSSRGRGRPAGQISRGSKGKNEHHKPKEWTGVNPLPPILPSMPRFKPGDQGG